MELEATKDKSSNSSKKPSKPTKKVVKSDEISEQFERYAIFQTGGKQYQGLEGKTIAIEKLEGQPGDTIEFKEVLLRKNGEGDIQIGQPFLEAPIKASIVKQIKGPKVTVFKFKRRKKYRVKKGHRQPHTVIRIEAI